MSARNYVVTAYGFSGVRAHVELEMFITLVRGGVSHARS